MKKIQEMPEFSRPREKLKDKGVQALSDTELITIILGSGNKGQDVVNLASKIVRLVTENKGNITLDLLLKVEGIGLAKASQILACIELSRRSLIKDSFKISSAKDVIRLLGSVTRNQQEYFVCFSLNGANEIIRKRIVSMNLLNEDSILSRNVFTDIITDRAASVIFVHHNPASKLKPDSVELKIYKQLSEAGKILGIIIYDFIIVSKKGCFSFRDKGLNY
jgi:DNA repair protein RadC